MARIHVDGRELAVQPEDNLLQACLSHGLDLPYFCWHPALGSVGACRQCAVKQFRDEHDRDGSIVMACMTQAVDGARISITDPEAGAFRASVIEWLMTNHPHDCPVCEEGGECHLQDMTLLSGHVYRRYRFNKRTHRNQYLGPFVKHEMNRCIACYRCVRFYRDYAGGRDLDVFGAHNHVYFGRQADGVLESEFSGNLVEVCPTGVFTDKTLSAAYTRKWDLQGAPSVCVHCGVGCNVLPNARYGELRRSINRYHHEINGYFLCDRGRYGYGFVNGATRLRRPQQRVAGAGGREAISCQIAHEQLAAILRVGAADVIGIGSPRASLESNFALRRLVGAQRFYLGVADAEGRLLATVLELLRETPAATLREAQEADAALILGENVPDSAPRLALALRQMVRHAGFELAARQKIPPWQDAAVRNAAHGLASPLFIASTDATRLDDVATDTLHAATPDLERLGFAVAHAIDAAAPAVPGLSTPLMAQVQRIAHALQSAAHPLVVSGVDAGSEALLRAAAAIVRALRHTGREARLLLTVPECNSLGLALLGGAPLSAALEALSTGRASAAVVLENDLYRRADRTRVDSALQTVKHLVVLDHTLHETAQRAALLLPAATYAESTGTLINYEGRAQRYFQLLFAEADIRASWRWLNDAACAIERDSRPWQRLDEVIATLGEELPALAAVRSAAPAADYRFAETRIASAPHRQSGRTAMYADRTMHEPAPPHNPDAPYTDSMEGYYGQMPAALYPFFWAPAWNAEGLNKFQQEVGGPLRGGEAGVRLIEPSAAPPAPTDAYPIPAAFTARSGEWLLVPRYRVFGSDELSALAPAVTERISAATLGLNPQDAELLGVAAGEPVRIGFDGLQQCLPAELRPALPRGVATLPVGLPGQPWRALPAWAKLMRSPA